MEEDRINTRLLSLLRAALWQTPADASCFSPEPVRWDELRELSLRQTVGILVGQGALSLPDPLCPPKEWMRASLAYSVRNMQAHRLLNDCLAEAVYCLKEAGITLVLLKGQAYAQQYPQPEWRQCGDIDLYIGETDYPRAVAVARACGWQSRPGENNRSGAKHYGCYLHGVRIELHRVAAILDRPAANRRFQRWSHDQLSRTTRTMRTGETDVPLPPPLFDVLFVFLHLYHHFLNGGVGLRQLCDWVLLLHAHSSIIDYRELETLLRRFGLLRGWKMFGCIAVDRLGLPAGEFPFYSSRYGSQSGKILAVILREGNFGRYAPGQTPRPDGYWQGKLHSYIRYRKRLFTLFPLAPKDVARCYGQFLYKGFRQIFIDKLCGKRQE